MSANFILGDVVRPLNETGEGTVTGFRKDGTVLVTLQDGFEIPFLPKQLVLIRRTVEEKIATHSTVSSRVQSLPGDSIYLLFSSEAPLRNEAQLALHMANSFKDAVYVIVYGIEGRMHRLISSSVVSSKQVNKLHTMALKDLISIDRLFVQVLFMPAASESIPAPHAAVIRHQVPALADPASWTMQEVLAARGLHFKVCGGNSKVEEKKKTDPTPRIEPAIQREEFILLERDGYHEIDLHIEELIEDTAGMDNAAIIQHQLRMFGKCIDEARARRLWKFVAIHGVGKGVLRDAVRNRIKEEGLQFQDASYQRYGYGATEVLMR